MKILLLVLGMQGKAALHDLVRSSNVTKIIAAYLDYEKLKQYVRKSGFGDKVFTPYYGVISNAPVIFLL